MSDTDQRRKQCWVNKLNAACKAWQPHGWCRKVEKHYSDSSAWQALSHRILTLRYSFSISVIVLPKVARALTWSSTCSQRHVAQVYPMSRRLYLHKQLWCSACGCICLRVPSIPFSCKQTWVVTVSSLSASWTVQDLSNAVRCSAAGDRSHSNISKLSVCRCIVSFQSCCQCLHWHGISRWPMSHQQLQHAWCYCCRTMI